MPSPRFIYSSATLNFRDHIFPVRKYAGVRDRLLDSGQITDGDLTGPGEPLTRAQVERVHTAAYLDRLREYASTVPEYAVAELEVPCYPETLAAVELACAGTFKTCRTAIDTREFGYHIGGGFHHAFADHGEGFCILNDVAVALRLLLDDGAITRATVIDVDVHQGNGTAHIFHDEPRVTTCSIHNQRIYPPKRRSDLDIGLMPGTGDTDYLAALEPAVRNLIGAVSPAPDLLVYVAGADPFEEDQLGRLKMTKAGLRARDEMVLGACAARDVPVAIVLAGGYARDTADVVDIHVTTARVCLAIWPAD